MTGLAAWWRRRRRRVLTLWAAGLGATLLVTGASSLGHLEPLQAATLDLLQRVGAQQFPPEVVIVAIDDAAFERFGERQPIPRGYLARVVRGAQRSGAAVIGLDVNLRVATAPAEDGGLAAVLLERRGDGPSRVVLANARLPDSGPLADPAVREAIVTASDRVPVDRDGVIRRAAFVVPHPSAGSMPAFALALVAAIDGTNPPALLERATRDADGRISPPVWRAGTWQLRGPALGLRPGERWRINFVGPANSFLTIPSDAVAALAEPEAQVATDNALRGRIVIVGATFQESRDFFQTPHGRLAGVEIHANIAHMLATRRLIRPAGWLASLGIQVAAVLASAVILTLLRPVPGSLLAVALTLLVAVPASYVALHGLGHAVDFVLPVLVTCVVGLTAHGLARRRLRDSFERYVGRDVLAQVLAEDVKLRGDRREVSILVSDIRGFTTLSEKLPVEAVAAQLNEYFPAMVDAIFAQRGTVDDFIGDGILAVFGAPLPDPDHAGQAARAAVAMQAALEQLNRRWEARGLPVLRMGIGIHTGVVFAGNVGSPDRVKYTVIGDPVNVTARLEGLNKDLETAILLTEEARTALGDRAETRYRGEITVKGRSEALRVHELVAIHRADRGGDSRPLRRGCS
ncbi:MAG: CHASE2 domain-containing protein [Candidatus Rokuibacteriota bacterium]